MTDLASDITIDTPSTVIDAEPGPSASGGGTPSLTEPVEGKPQSLRADLEAAFKEDADKAKADKADAKAEPKAEEPKAAEKGDKAKLDTESKKDEPKAEDKKTPEAKDDKPEPKQDEASAAKEAKPEDKLDGSTKFHEPPKKFLPDSREVWRNVPRAVRRDIDTMVQEHDIALKRFEAVSQRYDRIRDFDELAHRNGRDLRESLTRINQIENLMQQNPIAGLQQILMEAGPRKADGQPVSLFELAQFVMSQGADNYQRMVTPPPQQQQPQENPEVAELKRQLAEMQHQQLAATVIEPFKAKHPRYDELQDDIAFFLESGKISQSLSPMERLGAAYDMAVRINPASQSSASNDDREPAPEEARRADTDFSGSKSIKSSPGSVTEEVDDQAKGGESIRESLQKEMKRLNRA